MAAFTPEQTEALCVDREYLAAYVDVLDRTLQCAMTEIAALRDALLENGRVTNEELTLARTKANMDSVIELNGNPDLERSLDREKIAYENFKRVETQLFHANWRPHVPGGEREH